MGLIWTDVYAISDFQKSCGGFLTRYLSCFRPGCFQIRIAMVFGRDQEDVRRKVMQIRGGISSKSALFELFVSIEVYDCLVNFESNSPLPVSISEVLCSLNLAINRMAEPAQ